MPSLDKRLHLVLVPGFGGFDAIGQLAYYAGVTPVFQERATGNEVLHYFDNFPTAAVATRASRLQAYLAKRMARGEISKRDDVILLGHSTGGLDIRWMLWSLQRRKDPFVVDGGARVEPGEILERVRRVVFLSVPQWGTNIADWVRAHMILRQAVVGELRLAATGSQFRILDKIENAITGAGAWLTGAGLLRAVEDALAEANEHSGRPGPLRAADAHEAASQLELFLRHITSDFHAIDDLASQPPAGAPDSPAHFDAGERQEEFRRWRGHRIDVRSYVTLGKRPFRFEPGSAVPQWELTSPWAYTEFVRDCALGAGTDIVYRIGYRACAGGPFGHAVESGDLTRRFPGAPSHAIELWDNDGIVNTGSMLWSIGENVLVPGDHMDIVGHYKPVAAAGGSGRKYEAYDLLKSGSGFGDELFRAVWREIFAFCAGSRHSRAAAA